MARQRKAIVILALASVCFACGLVLFVVLEPNAARYQGKTVRDWCSYFTATGQEPSVDVIDTFGSAALPDLLSSFRFSTHLYQIRSLLNMGSQHNAEGQTVYDWVRNLHDKDPRVFDQLLCSKAKSAPTLLKLLSMSEPELKNKLERSTNSTVYRIQQNATAAIAIK